MSARGLFPRYIADLLRVVYSAGVGVFPKGRRRQINAVFFTIGMHVDAIFVFVWTRWYVASRSVFPIRVHLKDI